MTEKKKIAESVEVRISLGAGTYEHIILTKYAEKEIEYNSAEEMVEKESELNGELVNSLIRDMRALPDRLGKKTEAVQQVEEVIKSKIPAWLENENVPNLANANMAKKTHERSVDAQQANKEKQESKLDSAKKALDDFADALGDTSTPEETNVPAPPKDDIENDKELFQEFDADSTTNEVSEPEQKVEETKEAEEPASEKKEEELVATTSETEKSDLDDDWEDFFDEK